MPDIIAAITEGAAATEAVAKQVTQKDAEKNTPAVIAAAEAAKQQAATDAVNAAIAKGDLDEVRKQDAE